MAVEWLPTVLDGSVTVATDDEVMLFASGSIDGGVGNTETTVAVVVACCRVGDDNIDRPTLAVYAGLVTGETGEPSMAAAVF